MGPLILDCSDEAIKQASRAIVQGKLVVYPTDTLYGLGCDALDKRAIQRVFKIKKRRLNNPLSIAVCNLHMLRKFASFDDRAMQVMERFLPGPVTFILKKKGLSDLLTGGAEKVGIRVPENRTALRLIIGAGVPIVSTSANISGETPPKTAEEASKQLRGVDVVLDGGRVGGQPSTVVDLTAEQPRILREGKKPSWEIMAVVDEVYSP
jgi:L-threonylcarbamoyladenylate synthase